MERMVLTFIMAVLGYALMLIVMTYIVVSSLKFELIVRGTSSPFVLGWHWVSLSLEDSIPIQLARQDIKNQDPNSGDNLLNSN
jgi:hypothetical protein